VTVGIPERRRREKERRKNEIIDAAEQVFFSKGYDLATMDDVAEKAELSKGTLYLYFKSKEDLYLSITLRGLEILRTMFIKAANRKDRGLDQIYAIGQAYCEFARKHRNYFISMMRFHSDILGKIAEDSLSESHNQEGEKVLEICALVISRGIADGSIRPDIDPQKTAIILWGQTTGILQLSMNLEDHIAEKFEQFHIKGIEDIISSSLDLTRSALEFNKKGGKS
jgi:TetR/AcrR family transcriptional regulator